MDLSQSVAAEPVGVQDSVAVSREAPGVPSEQIPPTPEVAPEASSTLVETVCVHSLLVCAMLIELCRKQPWKYPRTQ